MRFVPVIAVATILVAGCLQGPAGGENAIEDDVRLLPGPARAVELNLDVARGGVVAYEWHATDPNRTVDFNIHRHADEGVVYLEEDRYARHNGTVALESGGGASWMWSNPGSEPIDVHYRITGDFTVRGG